LKALTNRNITGTEIARKNGIISFRLQVSGCRFQVAGCRLQVSGFGLVHYIKDSSFINGAVLMERKMGRPVERGAIVKNILGTAHRTGAGDTRFFNPDLRSGHKRVVRTCPLIGHEFGHRLPEDQNTVESTINSFRTVDNIQVDVFRTVRIQTKIDNDVGYFGGLFLFITGSAENENHENDNGRENRK
jgi:hypothetical protein